MKVSFKNRRNEKIVGDLLIPDKNSKEISIIVHGFSSNRTGGSTITAKLLKQNKLNSLTIDLDNFGESSPKFEEMTPTTYSDTIIDTINYCNKKDFKTINIIGTSSGGLSTMITALKYSKLNKLILRAPSPSDAESFRKKLGKEKIAIWKKKGYHVRKGKNKTKKIGYCYYEDALKHDMYKDAKNIKIPTLIIHGTKDESVPLNSVKKLHKHFPKSKLIIINGADHKLGVNGDFSKSQKLIVEWLKK